MRIRGHHLLCLLHFEGKGYSRKFVDNMFRVLYNLENGIKFSLVIGVDDICRFCPHNEGENCRLGDDSVKVRDKKVIELLGLKEKELYSFNLVKEEIYSKMSFKDFLNICDNCEWFYLCLSKNKFKNPL